MCQSCSERRSARECLPLLSTSAYWKTQPTPVASGPSSVCTPWGSRDWILERYSSVRRRAQEGGDDRIGDLVLDDVRAAVPLRIDDDLRVGEVRQRIERNPVHRPQPDKDERRDDGERGEAVGGAEADEAVNHERALRSSAQRLTAGATPSRSENSPA